MKRSGVIWGIVACAVAVGLLAFAARARRAPEEEEGPEVEPLVEVRVATAETREVSPTVVVTGRIQALPNEETQLSAPIEGRLTRVVAREGSTVSAGELLAEIENRDLAGAVTAAQGSLAEADADRQKAELTAKRRVEDEKGQVAQAEAALQGAQAKLDLLRAGARPEQIQQARAELAREEAKLAALEHGTRPEDIAAARHALAAEQADLERLRKGPLPQEVSEAEQELAAAQAELDQLRAGPRPQEILEARAKVRAATTAQETADAEAKRQSRLYDNGISSLAQKQAAAAAAATAASELESARQQLSILEAGTRKEEIRAQEARVRQAEAALDVVKAGSRPEAIAAQEAKTRAVEQELRKAEAGPRPEELDEQRAQVEGMRKALELVQAPPRLEDVSAAEAAVRDAGAALDMARAGRFETQAVATDVHAAEGRHGQAAGSLQIAQAVLGKSVIRAPIDGTVAKVLANAGETVSPGTPILELLNLNAVQLRGRVSVSDLVLLSVGQEASIEVEGIEGRTLAGRVAVIKPDIEPETSTGEVVIWLPNDDAALREDMFATAKIAVGPTPRVVVPRDAVVPREGEQFVYVVDEESVAHETLVETGEATDGFVEVLKGLSGGEIVVTEGAFGLPEEAPVSIRQ